MKKLLLTLFFAALVSASRADETIPACSWSYQPGDDTFKPALSMTWCCLPCSDASGNRYHYTVEFSRDVRFRPEDIYYASAWTSADCEAREACGKLCQYCDVFNLPVGFVDEFSGGKAGFMRLRQSVDKPKLSSLDKTPAGWKLLDRTTTDASGKVIHSRQLVQK